MFFTEVTGNRLSDHYARNIFIKVPLKIAVSWILLRSKILYQNITKFVRKYRTSHPEVLCKKDVLRNFTRFTGNLRYFEEHILL